MLKSYKTLISSTIAVAALAAALAACGGGGGGGGSVPNVPPGNGGGGGGATTPPPPPPASATGQMMIGANAMSNAQIVFTCGCSAQAGTVTADANGNYTITTTVNGFPAPNPQYTAVPGRNYVVVGAAPSGSKAESWTMIYYGSQPSHNLYISPNNVSDVYATAAALYVFFNSHNNNDVSFDDFNFNAVAAFASSLRTAGMSGNNAAEAKLLADIVAEQNAGHTLFPSNPAWNPHSPSTSALISGDLTAVKNAGDAALPTPCPGGAGSCTGTPSP